VSAADEIRRADLFAAYLEAAANEVAGLVHDLVVKTHAADREKIALIKEPVAGWLDVGRILGVAAEVA
jgi:hypothetical protein